MDFNSLGACQTYLKRYLQSSVTAEDRAYALNRMQKKDMPYLKIQSILFKRIILTIQGEIVGYNSSKSYGIRFVTEGWTQMFYPDHLTIEEDGHFTLSLNILCSNDEQPLASGQYQMVLFELYPDHKKDIAWKPTSHHEIMAFGDEVYKISYNDQGHVKKRALITREYPAYIDSDVTQFCDTDPQNPWNFMVKRTNASWLCVASYEDVDDLSYHLFVNYRPHPNVGVLFVNHRNKKEKRAQKRLKNKTQRQQNLSDLKMWLIQKLFHHYQKQAKHEGNIILFCSASRAEIGGNEKFIYDRMIERGLDQKFQFRFDFKESITTSRSNKTMIRLIQYLATSDMIVIDDYYPLIYDFDYDPRVKIIQVWHACGAFKTVGFERIEKGDAPVFNTRTHKCYTHVIVSSELSARHNAEAFCISEKKFYITGIPRTDIFFDPVYKEEITKKMLDTYPQCKGKKVYLYAPTFRGTNARDAYFPYGKVDLVKWGKLLEKEDAILLIKMHPFVTRCVDIPKAYKDRIFDLSSYREINDILFIADVLITDYSSVIYEMSLLNKPMVFYAFDQHSYEISRDFYESYEETVPGKIVHDFDELMDCLEKQDYEFHKMDHFIQKNFSYMDGKSTDRVIDQVFLDMPQEKTIAE